MLTRLLVGVLRCLVLVAATSSLARAQQSAQPAAPSDEAVAEVPQSLAPYTSCHFPDDLRIAKLDPLRSRPMARTVMTPQGSRQIVMPHGERIMFSYPFLDFYANVKVEELPSSSNGEERRSLLGALDWLIQSGSVTRSHPDASLQHFEASGVDRGELKGGCWVLTCFLTIKPVW